MGNWGFEQGGCRLPMRALRNLVHNILSSFLPQLTPDVPVPKNES